MRRRGESQGGGVAGGGGGGGGGRQPVPGRAPPTLTRLPGQAAPGPCPPPTPQRQCTQRAAGVATDLARPGCAACTSCRPGRANPPEGHADGRTFISGSGTAGRGLKQRKKNALSANRFASG